MALAASDADIADMRLYPPRAAVLGWIFFAWAAEPYFTLITTFVFAPYFATHVASDPATGQSLWGFATAAAGLVAKTMSDIIAKQTDLLRSEGSEIAKSAAAFGGSLEPVEAVENYVAAVRGGAEGMLSNLRDIQDLMRGCAWGLFGLYVDSFSVAAGNGRPVHEGRPVGNARRLGDRQDDEHRQKYEKENVASQGAQRFGQPRHG